MHYIENAKQLSFYIQPLIDVGITISSTKNLNGILSEDDFGNLLNSPLTVAYTPISTLDTYGYGGDLLLFNDDSFVLVAQGENTNFYMSHKSQTRYRVGALLEQGTYNEDGSSFDINLANKDIFKVFLNSKEITSYISSPTKITITGDDLKRVDFVGNDLRVITYPTDQTITSDVTLNYRGVETAFTEDFLDCDYLDESSEFTKLEIMKDIKFNDIRTLVDHKDTFQVKRRGITTSSDYVIKITDFQDGEGKDLKTLIGRDEFRLIRVNPYYDSVIMYHECSIYGSVDEVIALEGNTQEVEVTTSGYIKVGIVGNNLEYSGGTYNVGVFGGVLIENYREDLEE